MGERTRGRNNNARTSVFAKWDAPRALSPRCRGHFRPLIAPLYGGTHVRSPLGAPKACCRLSPGYIFARGRAWIAGLYGGKHARTPSGASKTNSRLNFGYILARSRDLASAPWPFSAPDRCSIWGNARAAVLGLCISVLSRTSG